MAFSAAVALLNCRAHLSMARLVRMARLVWIARCKPMSKG
jgi:hypothetical protein